jgi:poly-gamma-glutamate synthesis protein (capsule biosynthesis protein)
MDERLNRWALTLSLSLGAGLVFCQSLQTFVPGRVEAATFWRGPIAIPKLAAPRPWRVSEGSLRPVDQTPSILFVGDIMLDRKVAARSRGNLDYPFEKLPSSWFETFDFAVGNLEGPVTDRRRSPEKSIDFFFPPTVVPTLQETGIDAFSQANNHALDQGREGYDDSVARLRKAGFLVFGDQIRDGEEALAIQTIRGQRVAFLGFNTTDNALDKTEAAAVIKQAKSKADRLVAFTHWGTEYRHAPDASSVEDAHWLIDQGVDAVIGGHPHWEQGISVYKGKPIVFSLGNFIFDQDFSQETQQGLAVSLTMRDKETVMRLYPIEIIKSQPRVVEGEERARRLRALTSYSDPLLKDQIETGKVSF